MIRVDASLAIGTGHVYRMLALADWLAAHGVQPTFASRRLPGDLIAYVAQRGYATLVLGDVEPENRTWLGVSIEREIADMRALVRHGVTLPRWILVDHYEIGERWETALRALGPRVFAIDDLGRRHSADVVLDATLGAAERYTDRLAAHTRLLTGPQFAFVRKAFYDVRRQARERDGTIRRVLVFYGGVDATDETTKALRALRSIAAPLVIDAIVGSRAPHRTAVEAEATRDPRVRFWTDRDDMAEVMAGADLALGAGGTATWERCVVGLPAILTAIAPNQDHVVAGLHAAGAAIGLGRAETVDAADIERAVRRLLDDPEGVHELGRRSAQLVAGCESARETLLALFTGEG